MNRTTPGKQDYRMHATLATLIDRLDQPALVNAEVIQWGSPVPCFGDPADARVATLGLNPSNREFVDEAGRELEGVSRRFHTLSSLGLRRWSDADARHLRLILDSCHAYFWGNPYDRWFKRLDQIVAGAGASFYDADCRACHLDLIPYATGRKWTSLNSRQRSSLLSIASDTLASLLDESEIRVLILNGRSVVERFQTVTGICMEREQMLAWSLPRERKPSVMGLAYRALVDTLSGVKLARKLLVLGYNHNVQSSYGVTNSAIKAIGEWIARAVKEAAV